MPLPDVRPRRCRPVCLTRGPLVRPAAQLLPPRPAHGRARAARQGAGPRPPCAAGSSRSRPTAAREDPGSHAYRGPTAAQRHDVRPARPALRVLHLRHALVRQRRVRRRRARASRCCCARRRRVRGDRRDAGRARRGARRERGPRQRPGQALPGLRHRRRPSTAPTSCAATAGHDRDDGTPPPRRPAARRASASRRESSTLALVHAGRPARVAPAEALDTPAVRRRVLAAVVIVLSDGMR